MRRWGKGVAAAGAFALVAAFAVISPLGGAAAQQAQRALDVFVTNNASAPVPVRSVDEAGRLPFRVFETSDIVADDTIFEGCLSTVPAGRRLVVESVSVFVFVPEGQAVLAALQFRAPGTNAKVGEYIVPLSSQGAVVGGVISRDRIAGTEALRAYVEPGESLEVVAIRNQDDLAGEFRCTVSGHFVTLP